MSKGYNPVLAHPERYHFLEGEIEGLIELKEMGVLFQVTIASFVGYYGPIPQKLAKELLKREMIDFIGSDLHRIDQIDFLEKRTQTKNLLRNCVNLPGC